MNRIEFLQRFLGTGLLLTAPKILEAAQAIPHKEVLLYEGFIAGFVYYEGNTLLDQMQPNDGLDLLREPDNRYDSKAIAIYWEGKKLGFMPRLDNTVLAAILDADLPCKAHIIDLYPHQPNWEKLRFGISLYFPQTSVIVK
jgi:HIRAN domain